MWRSKVAGLGAIRITVIVAAALATATPVMAASKSKDAIDISNVRVKQAKNGNKTVISITNGKSRIASFSTPTDKLGGTTICCQHDEKDDFWACGNLAGSCDFTVECDDNGICTPHVPE